MATDLSRARDRTQVQRRVTNNRAGVLPERRLDRAPEVTVRSDMRNAFRPVEDDVAEVRRALGLVDRAVNDFVEADNARLQVQAEADASQAVADLALGAVDPEKERRSRAYGVAIAMGRARQRLAEMEVALLPEVEDMLDRAAYADPTKGEEVVDLEDVNALIEERYRGVLLDQEGRPVDFGDPAANQILYDGLNRLRTQVVGRASTIIKQQTERRAMESIALRWTLDAQDGKAETFEDYMREASVLGVDMGTAKETLLAGAMEAAAQAGHRQFDVDSDGDDDDFVGPSMLERLANSTRGDGTPSFTPQERLQLRREAERLREAAEREIEKERQEASINTLAGLILRIDDGQNVSNAEVRQLIERGELLPEHADDILAARERKEADMREDIRWQRENISWQQSQADRRAAAARRAGGAGGLGGDLKVAIMSGHVPANRGLQEATRLYNRGQISRREYQDLIRTARSVPADSTFVQRSGAQAHEDRLEYSIRQGERLAGQPGRVSPAQWRARANAAREAFYTGLRTGASPDDALYGAYQAMGATPDAARSSVMAVSPSRSRRQ